jgi:hypothetical protein
MPQLITANTEFHQNTRTISIKYFHDLYWDVPYQPSPKANHTPVKDWIMTGSSVVSIERTKDSDSEGRYIILCKLEGFLVFRRQLQKMVMKLKDTIEKDEALKATALKVYQQYPTIMGQHHMGKHAEKNALGLLRLINVPAVARPAIKKISNRIEFNFDSAEDFPGIKPTTNNTTAKKPPPRKQTSWAKAVTATDTTSLASEPSDTERTVYSTQTGITTTDQQTMQSEAISVLTEYIQTARREDAALRKKERKEDEQRRKDDREERKLENRKQHSCEKKKQRNAVWNLNREMNIT